MLWICVKKGAEDMHEQDQHLNRMARPGHAIDNGDKGRPEFREVVRAPRIWPDTQAVKLNGESKEIQRRLFAETRS